MDNQELRDLPLKKVGKEVAFLQTDNVYVRKGEGAFLELKDGSILHAYTEYCGGNIRDHGEAYIAAVKSYDGGETWQYEGVFLEKAPDVLNLMSVSLLRLPGDEILMFYLKKTQGETYVQCRPCVRSSFDECKTWGEERCCVPEDDWYYVLNNDRVLRLQSGRILFATAVSHRPDRDPRGAAVRYVYSDDDGKTWSIREGDIYMPFENYHGFEEPGIYQHDNGKVWGYYRTDIGCQFEATSADDGATWSVAKPNIFFTGARSPMLVKKVCGKYTVAVFNPISLYTGRNLGGIRGRAPWLLAVSEDDGVSHDKASFTRLYYIEDDMDNDYSYPAILDRGDEFLLAYYHSNGRERPLNCLKIVSIRAEEISE